MMLNLIPDDEALRDILAHTKTIAVVGHSDKPSRTSYQIAQFLKSVGYIVYPVNPSIPEIDGQPCYPSLKKIPQIVDLVNVFRRSEYLNEIVDEAIVIQAKTFWTQLGIYDSIAAKKAIQGGLNVVMNACIKIEYLRLMTK